MIRNVCIGSIVCLAFFSPALASVKLIYIFGIYNYKEMGLFFRIVNSEIIVASLYQFFHLYSQ